MKYIFFSSPGVSGQFREYTIRFVWLRRRSLLGDCNDFQCILTLDEFSVRNYRRHSRVDNARNVFTYCLSNRRIGPLVFRVRVKQFIIQSCEIDESRIIRRFMLSVRPNTTRSQTRARVVLFTGAKPSSISHLSPWILSEFPREKNILKYTRIKSVLAPWFFPSPTLFETRRRYTAADCPTRKKRKNKKQNPATRDKILK